MSAREDHPEIANLERSHIWTGDHRHARAILDEFDRLHDEVAELRRVIDETPEQWRKPFTAKEKHYQAGWNDCRKDLVVRADKIAAGGEGVPPSTLVPEPAPSPAAPSDDLRSQLVERLRSTAGWQFLDKLSSAETVADAIWPLIDQHIDQRVAGLQADLDDLNAENAHLAKYTGCLPYCPAIKIHARPCTCGFVRTGPLAFTSPAGTETTT